MEDMVHAFDLMIADRYADDGVTTRFLPRQDKWSAGSRAKARHDAALSIRPPDGPAIAEVWLDGLDR